MTILSHQVYMQCWLLKLDWLRSRCFIYSIF